MGCFSDKPSEVEGFPMKLWNIEVYLLDEAGNEKPATCFTKVVYNLHPSFANPVQSMSYALDSLRWMPSMEANRLCSQRSTKHPSDAKTRGGESLI